jgi:hypothetical protein
MNRARRGIAAGGRRCGDRAGTRTAFQERRCHAIALERNHAALIGKQG